VEKGSTGYGRPYRLRLEKQWGLVDVEDCIADARWLFANRSADPGTAASGRKSRPWSKRADCTGKRSGKKRRPSAGGQ
jgi:hypothetical protein